MRPTDRAKLFTVLAVLSFASTSLAVYCQAAPAGLKKILPQSKESRKPEEIQLRDKWALLLGCNRFTDPGIQPLKFSSKNAADIGRLFKDQNIGRFAQDHVVNVIGPEATRANFQKALDEWLYKKALPNDLVILYLATRITPAKDSGEPLICFADSRPDDPGSMINLVELLKTARTRIGSEYLICMLDTSPVKEEKVTSTSTVDTLAKNGVVILSASELFCPSYDNQQVLRSRFANHFIEGMRAYAGAIPFYALAEGIWQNIKQEDEADPSHQKQTAKLSLPQADAAAATIPLGIPVKIAGGSINIGHKVDEIAMKRPDLVLPKTQVPGQQPKPPRQQAPVQASDDEEEIDTKLDFGPYMAKMKLDIQKKWQPPKGLESRKVKVVFTIMNNGTIVNPEIVQPSGVETVDQSAMDALKAASPLEPLPKGAPRSVDIQYTFDWLTRMGK